MVGLRLPPTGPGTRKRTGQTQRGMAESGLLSSLGGDEHLCEATAGLAPSVAFPIRPAVPPYLS